MTDFEVSGNATVDLVESFGRRRTPWRGKRQFRRARGKLRGERRAWAQHLRYHPRVSISHDAHFGAMCHRYVTPQIVEIEDALIMEELRKAVEDAKVKAMGMPADLVHA